MRLFTLFCFLLTVPSGCDGSSVAPRNGEESGSSEDGGEYCPPAVATPIVVATPEETAACACSPDKGEDACAPGLDCVQTEPDVHRCLARWDGTNKEGGDWLTFCSLNGEPKAITATVDNSNMYCSACVACQAPTSNSLVCRE